MPQFISIYLDITAEAEMEKADEELRRLGIARSTFFQKLLPSAALRLKEMNHKDDIFNANFGPLKL